MQSFMSKPLTILYFAWLRERTGAAQEELSLPGDVETIADESIQNHGGSGGF
jgi:molybdopterin converting factor small subunit